MTFNVIVQQEAVDYGILESLDGQYLISGLKFDPEIFEPQALWLHACSLYHSGRNTGLGRWEEGLRVHCVQVHCKVPWRAMREEDLGLRGLGGIRV